MRDLDLEIALKRQRHLIAKDRREMRVLSLILIAFYLLILIQAFL